ncbi:MAG: hypothetical protein EBX40_00440 [Gammaproteobacteria bacterium]|nr:hypothetical protein [Gammaproteobacteria bacterium]
MQIEVLDSSKYALFEKYASPAVNLSWGNGRVRFTKAAITYFDLEPGNGIDLAVDKSTDTPTLYMAINDMSGNTLMRDGTGGLFFSNCCLLRYLREMLKIGVVNSSTYVINVDPVDGKYYRIDTSEQLNPGC